MCDFFVKADPIKYEQRSRTVRIHGVLTSLRLENMVWDVLAEMAEMEGRTTNAMVSLFHDEILAQRGEVVRHISLDHVRDRGHPTPVQPLPIALEITPIGRQRVRRRTALDGQVVEEPADDQPGSAPWCGRAQTGSFT